MSELLVQHPQNLTQAEVDHLRSLGFTEAEILQWDNRFRGISEQE